MKRITLAVAAIVAAAGTAYAFTDEGSRRFSEFLNGLNEAAAVVSTTGNGTFQATIAPVIFRLLPQRVRLWGLKNYYKLPN
jgi:hypothetical protein